MKKLLYLLMLPLLMMASCKKDDSARLAATAGYDVTFNFNPNGIPSSMYYINITTGETQSFTARTDNWTFTKKVKVGEHYKLEMKGRTTGGDNLYYVKVSYSTTTLVLSRALGSAAVQDQDLLIDKTFTEADFK